MTKIDFVRKFTSRKFWLTVAAFVTGLLVAFKVDAATAETVSGLIMSAGAVIAYVFAEGWADAGWVEAPGD